VRVSSAEVRSLLVSLAVLLASATPAAATFPGRNGVIAFSVSYEASGDCGDGVHSSCGPSWANVFTVTPTGHRPRALTHHSARDGAAAGEAQWSPDGRRIAYADGGAIYIARADGTHRRWVVRGASPAWSPDGRQLAFVRPRGGISRMRLSHGTARHITSGRFDLSPDWSSTGVLAFERPGETSDDVYTVRPDGSHLTRVTRLGGSAPSWSPDGRRIVFTRTSGDLRVVRAAGGRSHALATGTIVANRAVWSPDGRRLVVDGYNSFGGQSGLSIVRPDGTVVRSLGPSSSYVSSWQALARR
jgi:Tol biopolymer transport system component